MKNRVGVVQCFEIFLVCSEFALGGLAIVCLEEKMDMFVDACVTEIEFSQAENVIENMVGEEKSESAWAGGVVGAQTGDC